MDLEEAALEAEDQVETGKTGNIIENINDEYKIVNTK